MKRKAAVIAYDISCNKRRRKVFRTLQAWSLDSQYSLFECLLSQREAEELFIQLSEVIDDTTDTLLLAWVDYTRQPKAISDNTHISFQIPSLYVS